MGIYFSSLVDGDRTDVDFVEEVTFTTGTDGLPVKRPQSPAGGRYVLGDLVAEGGQAAIYAAHDEKLHRIVALKQLRNRTTSAVARFHNEALITARLAHPAIVPIYDIGDGTDGAPYIAMKLVKGATLGARILNARTEAARRDLLDVVVRVTEAIAYAHRERIVHRDLKPSNILVGDFGEVMVIDWGIAKDLADKMSSSRPMSVGVALTAEGTVLGTPGFMAPEQAAGCAVDERADVYALGVLIYLTVCGVLPSHGLSASELLGLVRTGEAGVPLEERAPGTDLQLCAVVDRALAPSPSERYRDGAELLAALRFALGQEARHHHG